MNGTSINLRLFVDISDGCLYQESGMGDELSFSINEDGELICDKSASLEKVEISIIDEIVYAVTSDVNKIGGDTLFVSGVVELTMFDIHNGNVIGYDNVGSSSALNYSFDLAEITGGIHNNLVGLIPHTTRLSGNYTSEAFSLSHRALASGGNETYNTIVPICETITATSTTLTVRRIPAKSQAQPESDMYAWCYVREHNAKSYEGTNYGISISTKTVLNFTAEIGKRYDVFYFTAWVSATKLTIPGAAKPATAMIQLKWAVYSEQNNSRKLGTLKGYLYVVIPRAALQGEVGMDGTQTTTSKTNYTWRGIGGTENMPEVENCERTPVSNLAYYIYVPCRNDDGIRNIVVVGGELILTRGKRRPLNIRIIMKDGSTRVPDYSEFSYNSSNPSCVEVNESGVVHAAERGTAVVTAKMKSTDRTLGVRTVVTVI